MTNWIKTNFPGVRYRKHPTRKHGVQYDRYFTIRYKLQGKDREEGLGWASQKWTAQKAYDYLKELKENIKVGKGPRSLKESREIAQDRQEQEDRESLSFAEIFEKKYFPITSQNKKRNAANTEGSLFKLWIDPVIGKLPLKEISPIHLEKIKRNMATAKRTPRTANYALSVIRQLYNFSKNIGLYAGECPVKKIKIPREDNRRLRFLSHEEAEIILAALKEKSQDVHDMALLSLHCGLRAGEVFSLTWADVDIGRGILTLRNTKSGRTRHAYMTQDVKILMSMRNPSRSSEFVFPARIGTQRGRISKTFSRVIDSLALNQNITDPRQRVVWHTLRHTFASWLVQSGVSLYTVQHLMGHENISQTERYSHLRRETLQDAMKIFEKDIHDNHGVARGADHGKIYQG